MQTAARSTAQEAFYRDLIEFPQQPYLHSATTPHFMEEKAKVSSGYTDKQRLSQVKVSLAPKSLIQQHLLRLTYSTNGTSPGPSYTHLNRKGRQADRQIDRSEAGLETR